MRDDNKFSLRHIVVTLVCAIIGILCICSGNSLVSNVGSVLLVSGIYTVIDNMYLKKSLIELIIQKVRLDKEIDDTGLIKVDSTLTNIGYKEYYENAQSYIDIIHNYARTWTTNNFDFIRDTVMNKECKLRVVLLNPESPFIPALEAHYGYAEGHLVELNNEVTDKWKSLYRDVEEKREACLKKKSSTYKNKHCGSVELYYFNGQPTNSIYRIDDKIIVVNAKNSKEKSVYLPYTIFQDNGEKGLYHIYLKEIETIINEAKKVELVEDNNNADK
ncbi:MAG: hypothetical protein HFJ09_10560 [Lachnospiraceae bacterium]|nr:hypothetical protein [Lachnospiraceae bacterium]